MRAQNSLKFNDITIFELFLCFGMCFFFPNGLTKELQNGENPTTFGFDDFYDGLTHFHIELDATKNNIWI